MRTVSFPQNMFHSCRARQRHTFSSFTGAQKSPCQFCILFAIGCVVQEDRMYAGEIGQTTYEASRGGGTCSRGLHSTWISCFMINKDLIYILSSLGICTVQVHSGLMGQVLWAYVPPVRNGIAQQRCLCCGEGKYHVSHKGHWCWYWISFWIIRA